MPKNIRAIFGRRVRALRQEAGLSQDEFAHRCRMHRNYLGGIERGERNPSLEAIVRIAVGLGISIQKLFPRNYPGRKNAGGDGT